MDDKNTPKTEENAETLKNLTGLSGGSKLRDQTILNLWYEDSKNYVDNAIIALGMEDTQKNRDAICSLKNFNAAFDGADEFLLDTNAARRRRRAVYAERTRGINYAGICVTTYSRPSGAG